MTDPTFERPDHPDMDRLIEVLAQGLDKAAGQEGFDLESYASQFIDPKSMSYLALQRVIPVLELKSPAEVLAQLDTLMRVCVLYLEAAVIGIEFERSRS